MSQNETLVSRDAHVGSQPMKKTNDVVLSGGRR